MRIIVPAGAALAALCTLASPALAQCGRSPLAFGETAGAMAVRCGVNMEALKLRNPGLNADTARQGLYLDVPPPALPTPQLPAFGNKAMGSVGPIVPRGVTGGAVRGLPQERLPDRARAYVVRPGDTLSSIALRQGVRLSDLMRVNPGVAPGGLGIGSHLLLPPR
jgi:hypothetical protein